ncbi:flagellar protein FlaG [Porticoccaceae bacterium]|nr:flagellar protein FlaG [Porticoccaceae bacterium]
MTSGDMGIKSSPPAEVVQARPPVQTGAAAAAPAEAQVKIEAAKTSAQDIGKELASRKGESISQISDNAAKIHEALETLNAAVKKVPTALHFSRDESSRRFVVQVTDTNTGEVIRKLPGDAVLRISKQLDSLKGVLFDEVF